MTGNNKNGFNDVNEMRLMMLMENVSLHSMVIKRQAKVKHKQRRG